MTTEKDMALVDYVIKQLEDLLVELRQKRTEQEAKRAHAN